MNKQIQVVFMAQLDAVEKAFAELAGKSRYDDLSDLSADDITHLVTIATSAVERIAGKTSTYIAAINRSLSGSSAANRENPKLVIGIVRGLKHDLNAGYLTTLEDMVYGEVFSDAMEMSSYLLEEGYKDPAAVIAGGALEQHLRKLCRTNEIDVEVESKDGTRPKKAEQMNSDLSAKEVVSKLDQKSVTAWLDLRNKAAHGRYDEYSKDQVNLMIAGVRDFIARTLA